jgi:hypothetical protein
MEPPRNPGRFTRRSWPHTRTQSAATDRRVACTRSVTLPLVDSGAPLAAEAPPRRPGRERQVGSRRWQSSSGSSSTPLPRMTTTALGLRLRVVFKLRADPRMGSWFISGGPQMTASSSPRLGEPRSSFAGTRSSYSSQRSLRQVSWHESPMSARLGRSLVRSSRSKDSTASSLERDSADSLPARARLGVRGQPTLDARARPNAPTAGAATAALSGRTIRGACRRAHRCVVRL